MHHLMQTRETFLLESCDPSLLSTSLPPRPHPAIWLLSALLCCQGPYSQRPWACTPRTSSGRLRGRGPAEGAAAFPGAHRSASGPGRLLRLLGHLLQASPCCTPSGLSAQLGLISFHRFSGICADTCHTSSPGLDFSQVSTRRR